jgi:microcystin degradation protein MlrC
VKRVGLGGLWHETNTYSVRSTSLPDFEAFELLDGDAIVDRHAGTGTVVGGMLDARGFEPVPLFTAGAWPAGRVMAETLGVLGSRFRTALSNAGRLDGVLLNLHGAMVADGEDDVERMVLALVRDVVGAVPVVAVFDLHGNPSPEMVALCDAVVVYDTYPHVDMRERGREAAEIMVELLDGARYRTLVNKVPVLVTPLAQGTDEQPMRRLEARARELEQDPTIRRVALFPGFPYSDVARAGFSVVITYLEDAGEIARAAAAEIAGAAERYDWKVERPDPAAAVAEAIRSEARPVVLADVADNIGGGAPGDGTALLAELLGQRAQGVVMAIADSEVAIEAARRGPGAALETSVGAKTDRLHGDAVPIRGRVVRVTGGRYVSEGTWMSGQEFSMGTTAVLDVGGVTLVVMERATPPFHSEQLTSQGIEPEKAAIIVAKGAIAWRAAFGDVVRKVIEVDTPGICPVNPNVLPRTTEPMRV